MKYKKKPIVIEAIQYKEGINEREILNFSYGNVYPVTNRKKIVLKVRTLDGILKIRNNDYLIHGIGGEFYPCRQYIFEKSYEKVEE